MKPLGLLVLLAALGAISLHCAAAEESLRGEDNSESDVADLQMRELEEALRELDESESEFHNLHNQEPVSSPRELIRRSFFGKIKKGAKKAWQKIKNIFRKPKDPAAQGEGGGEAPAGREADTEKRVLV